MPERKCDICGTTLPPDRMEGLCPRCVLKQVMEADATEPPCAPPALPEDVSRGTSQSPLGRVRYFGDYELLEEIARGGMGVVYRARQVSLDRFVALKMIRSGELASEAEVKRFHKEAEAAASLNHPNIVGIYEVGHFGGQHYYSMQLVEGESLAAKALRSAFADPRLIAQLMGTAVRAVHYAHQHGILHRDLKPGNILVDANGEPHITDFGLAKRGADISSLTVSGAAIGTPSFMAPEQAAGNNRHVTSAADIYGLGAVLYFLLTGRPPFDGETPLEIMRKVLEEEPVRPTQVRSRPECVQNPKPATAESQAQQFEIDRDLETICLKCLEKSPQARYASAAALAEDLDRWLKHEPIWARPTTNLRRMVKWVKRKPGVASLSAAVVVAAAIGLWGLFWKTPTPAQRLNNPAPIGAAAFMVHPHDTTAAPGSTATFGIVPVGEEPLSFQWKKDGIDLTNNGRIRGARTASLNIANVQAEDLGSYTVVASNVYASKLSETANLLFSPPHFEWARSLGGSGDEGCQDPAVVDQQGNVYVGGHFSHELEGAMLKSMGRSDVFLAKLNPVGRLQWALSAGGPGSDGGARLAVDVEGSVYASGQFSDTATFNETNLTAASAGKEDLFVVKYNHEGKLLWIRQIGGKKVAVFGAANDGTNGYLVTGVFGDTISFGAHQLKSAGPGDVYLARYAADGGLDWAISGGATNGGAGAGVAVDQAGNAYITGWIQGLTPRWHQNVFVAKYARTGVLLWTKQLDRVVQGECEGGQGIAVDSFGNAYVSTAGTNFSRPGQTVSVTKFSSLGALLWRRIMSGSITWFPKIAVDGAGNSFVIISVNGTATIGITPVRSPESADVYVVKYDPSGVLQWIQKSEGTGDALGKCVACGQSGEVYAFGTFSGTKTFGPYRLTSRGGSDVFVAKLIDTTSPREIKTTDNP